MQKEIVQGFRLSPQQRHLWLLQQDEQCSPYRAQCAILIEGALNVAIIKDALHKVVERHEILRTTFQCLPGMIIPLQVITDGGISWLNELDLSSLDKKEKQAQVEALLNEASQIPFDFIQGPLLRASLIKLSQTENMLLVEIPSLCADAVGMRNLVNEIGYCYMACLTGEDLTDEPMQYADLSEVLNSLMDSEDTETGREFWRRQDAFDLESIKLPFRKQPSGQREYRPERSRLTIHPELVTKLDSLALALDTQTSVLMLACWNALLSRLTQQSRIIVGVGYDGRKYEGLEEAVGLFAKYLPVACNVEEESTFRRLVKEVEEAGNEAGKWQEYFNQEQISGGESGDNSRYIGIGYEYEEEATAQQAAGVRIKIYRQQTCTDRFDLKLSCSRRGAEIEVEMGYDPAVYEIEEMERLTRQYEKLVSSVLEASDTPISKLDLIPDEQLHQLLVEFNDTNNDYTGDLCIHELFERQAERTPMATAVVYEQEEVTYRELNERANQMARYLKKQGVEPEQVVGLCVERSIEMVEGLLGILKAGGAYLPMDVGYPRERLRYMLEQTGARLVLTQEGLMEGLEDDELKVVRIEKEREKIGEESREKVESEVRAKNLAYVIYTSGSTGQPKGVMIEHRAICNRLLWMITAFSLSDADRFLQKTPFSFDASVWELYVPLFTGARLIMARPGGHQDSAYMLKVVAEQQITILQLVPSMLQVFLEEIGLETCKSLTRMFCGGENLPIGLQNRFFERLPANLHNLYGPTEASIDAASWNCSANYKGERVPIGYPIDNVQVYLLDPNLHPVPIGVPGELHIGGVGLARGYFGRPALTGEKFIPNPFSQERGARLYKTGDQAIYNADGSIEFLGRIDHQIKLRGFRIELGEIEAALSQHPAIREVAVVAKEASPGDVRIVAYLAPVNGLSFTVNELRAFLKQSLPDYMLPSAFVALDAMPLMPNGKVDRKALLQAELDRPDTEGAFVTPRTPIEEVLAGIWAELLGLEEIGVYDNFFDLGGHSLLATQVASRVREIFKVELPLQVYFDAPNVAGLAENIEKARRTEQGVQAPPIERVSRDRELPLSFAQQRLWFLSQLEPDSPFYNIPAAVRLTGSLNAAALERSLNEIIRRHETLRTTFAEIEGRPVQIIAPVLNLTLDTIDLQHLSDWERTDEINRLTNEEAKRPFDMAQGPLLRASLLKLSDDEHIGLLTMHHIISDGWSMGLLVGEMAALYEAFSNGLPTPLADLPIQYADYAVWQREWLQEEALAAQLSYWKRQIAGELPVLTLPTDRSRPEVQTYRGAHQHFALPADLFNALSVLSRQEGITLFMMLVAAFQTLLHRYTGEEDIIVGSNIANRNRGAIEGLIGFFINNIVLRTDLSGDPTFRELLVRVREVCLGAYTHQDLPFDKLVEELSPERSLKQNPLFQVMFVLQNAPSPALKLSGLVIDPLPVDNGSVAFDIVFNVWETDQTLAGSLQYNADLFDESTISRMLKHFQILLEDIVANTDSNLSQLSIISAEESEQLSNSFNTSLEAY